MREIDRLTIQQHQLSSLQLMEGAAAACLQAIAVNCGADLSNKKIQIFCGPGNNGGDGAALACQLGELEVQTSVILFGSLNDTKGDAKHNLERLRTLASDRANLSFIECGDVDQWHRMAPEAPPYDVIVDALFGTGLTRPLTGVFAEAVKYIATLKRTTDGPFIVSVDIPSGLDADKPEAIGPAVAADLTVTFTAPKVANAVPPASHLNGKLIVADVGSPRTLVEATQSKLFLTDERDVRDWLVSTRYLPDSFKNTHGHVLVLSGSRGYTGAAVLCANAAMRAGAGLVTVGTPVSAQSVIATTVIPEVMTTALAETDLGAVSDAAIEHVSVGSSRVDLQACKLEYSIVSPK